MRVSSPRRIAAFTLIELMVAVTIAGILAAVAYPAFTSFIQRSRRADAVAVLTAIVQAQERYRSNRAAYASKLDQLELTDAKLGKIAPNYSVELVGLGTPAGVSGYEAKASIKTTGAQKNDSDCAMLGVRFEGADLRHLATDKDGNDKVASCWPR